MGWMSAPSRLQALPPRPQVRTSQRVRIGSVVARRLAHLSSRGQGSSLMGIRRSNRRVARGGRCRGAGRRRWPWMRLVLGSIVAVAVVGVTIGSAETFDPDRHEAIVREALPFL